jgi:hypothetical protein
MSSYMTNRGGGATSLDQLTDVTLSSPSSGQVLIYSSGAFVNQTLRSSNIGGDFSILTFGTATTLEIGVSSIDPSFTATYQYTITNAGIKDNNGHAVQSITSPGTSFTYTVTNVKTTNNSTVVFTLTATDSTLTDSDTVTYSWRPYVYWGVDASPALSEAFIEGMSNSALASSRTRTFTVNAGTGEYICYAYPNSYGAATFTVGGFEGGFTSLGTVTVTNAYGIAQSYILYRSDNPSLGSTTVVVT